MHWLKQIDQTIMIWCNQRLSSPVMDRLLGFITHLGGATFTISCAILLIWFAEGDFTGVGYHCLFALAASHLVAVLIKNMVRRVRPFRMSDQVRVGNFPLKDYSFPSGHTTAIFALVTPLMLVTSPIITILLLCVALLVALSRVYWGYHYPLDCIAGGLIGFVTAIMPTWLLVS